ncbi:hypothetical protein DL96DRAFT_1610098 [Flagelloscypha sp. PMI_526]|nr:hypothetical protein DL96DRAFT_1610098 [Flagelloscypha sp. PMI_526]
MASPHHKRKAILVETSDRYALEPVGSENMDCPSSVSEYEVDSDVPYDASFQTGFFTLSPQGTPVAAPISSATHISLPISQTLQSGRSLEDASLIATTKVDHVQCDHASTSTTIETGFAKIISKEIYISDSPERELRNWRNSLIIEENRQIPLGSYDDNQAMVIRPTRSPIAGQPVFKNKASSSLRFKNRIRGSVKVLTGKLFNNPVRVEQGRKLISFT